MARFIHLISPILHLSLPVRFSFGRVASKWSSQILAWLLVFLSFYYSMHSHSTLLIGVATLQLGLGLLILLELILSKMNAGPLESRRLEMTAYCLGGVFLLLLCIYQFSEAYVELKSPGKYWGWGVILAVGSSMLGNLILLRLLWSSGLIRSRIRAVCQPLAGILLCNLLCLVSSLVIQFTQYIQLDALFSLVSGTVLFFLTAGIMIDAYWHLAEVETKGLKNSEIEMR